MSQRSIQERKKTDAESKKVAAISSIARTMGFLYRTTPDLVTNFHLFFQVLCIDVLATKLMAKWSRASGQSSGGLRVDNRAEIGFLFLHFF